MNKRLAISSENSQVSGNGRFSMFESNVTPFFGSMRKQKFQSLKQQSPFETYRANQQELNTQQIIQRIVKQNQSRSINEDGMGDFRLGFSFANEFHSQDHNNFSFDPTLIGQPFSIMSNFQSQSPKFFGSNASINPLFRSGFSTYSNPENNNRKSQSGFATTITHEKNSPFHDFFSFPIDPQEPPSQTFINQQPKKPFFDKQFEERSKDIIYEVESKFEYEGQTHILENINQSKSVSHQKASNSQKLQKEIEKKASEYEMLRQSIIKQISQMDSDEWEHRNEDFDESKNQSKSKSNRDSKKSQKILSEVQPQQKKINFNESIINKLFLESEKQMQNQVDYTDAKQLEISQNMETFRVKKNEYPHKRNYQQKNNDNIYESEVEQITNQRLDMIKKSSKTITGKSNLNPIQKSNDSSIIEKKEDSNHNKENSLTEENQNKRKRLNFNLKIRNRLNIKNQVIDQRQEFQNEQKLPLVRKQFFSENLSIQNDLYSEPIKIYQSSKKQTDDRRTINNIKIDTSLAPKIQNRTDHQNRPVEIQSKNLSWKEKKFNSFNLKRRTPKTNNSNDQIQQPQFENKNNETQAKVENVIKPQQKPPLKKFQLNLKRKYNKENNQKSLQQSQKLSQKSQKHSISSDGIKIDTKGFMDKVLNNNESGNNNKNQTNFNKDKKNPILNFKRINRFTSLFGKDAGKQKEKQKVKQKQEEKHEISTKKPVPQIAEQTPSKISKSPLPQLKFQPVLKLTSATNQYQSEQKKLRQTQNQVACKSYSKNQEGSQLQLQDEKKNPFVSKYIFSKRTPPKQFGKDNVQSKSKSVTFDTVKRVEINDNDDIDDDKLSFNSLSYQRFPDNNIKDIQAKWRENNLMKGVENMSKKQHPIQNNDQLQTQRRNLHSQSSSMPTISSRSRKSAEMMREILEVIEQAHSLQQRLLKVKRQREEEYRRISFLNRIAKQKFSDQRIKEMMDWREMEAEFDTWNVEINR